MRKVLILLAFFVLLKVIGCADDPPSRGIDSIAIDSIDTIFCNQDPCAYVFDISFLDTSAILGFSYYYFAKLVIGNIQSYAKPVRRYNQGQRLYVTVNANYFEMTPNQSYTLEVYRSDSSNGPPTSAGSMGPVNLGSFGNMCEQTCCTDPSLHKGYYYAGAIKHFNDIVGVQCSIKTRYGNICGYNNGSNDYGHLNAHVQITTSNTLNEYGQCGYLLQRDTLNPTLNKKYVYAEMKGTTYLIWIAPNPAPLDGTMHLYSCSLDVASGTWYFQYDNSIFQIWTDPFWQNRWCTQVAWTGEIYTRETDMPGTVLDPCIMKMCEYKLSGGTFQSANFSIPPDEIGSDARAEWDVYVTPTEFHFWDVNPLP